MKFTLAAGALEMACERYIAEADKEIEAEKALKAIEAAKVRWWHFAWLPNPTPVFSTPNFLYMWRGKAVRLYAICKHKSASTLLEVTDEEIGDIALHLIPSERTFDRI